MKDISRLRFLCRRGMKELDVLMQAYLDNHYAHASDAEKSAFYRILTMQDPDIYSLLMQTQTNPDKDLTDVIGKIRNSVKS